MEYACSVWDPHLKSDINKLERVQRQAARWITSSYHPTASVTDMLSDLKLDPLEERRRVHRLSFLYKILNDKIAVPQGAIDIVLTL